MWSKFNQNVIVFSLGWTGKQQYRDRFFWWWRCWCRWRWWQRWRQWWRQWSLGVFPFRQTPVVLGAAYHGEGKGPIYYFDLMCMGTEKDIFHCPGALMADVNMECRHDNDVSIDCEPMKPRTARIGWFEHTIKERKFILMYRFLMHNATTHSKHFTRGQEVFNINSVHQQCGYILWTCNYILRNELNI